MLSVQVPLGIRLRRGTAVFFTRASSGKVFDGVLLAEDVTQAPTVGLIEDLVQARTAEIAVDQQDLVADFGEGDSQVTDDGCLAFVGTRTGNHQDLGTVSVMAGGEDGSEGGAEGLRDTGQRLLQRGTFDVQFAIVRTGQAGQRQAPLLCPGNGAEFG